MSSAYRTLLPPFEPPFGAIDMLNVTLVIPTTFQIHVYVTIAHIAKAYTTKFDTSFIFLCIILYVLCNVSLSMTILWSQSCFTWWCRSSLLLSLLITVKFVWKYNDWTNLNGQKDPFEGNNENKECRLDGCYPLLVDDEC